MAAIVKEFIVEATPQRIWSALTRSDEIARWWTDDLSITPEVGSLAEFRFSQGKFIIQMEVAELDEGSKVRWISRRGPAPHWGGTNVIWRLGLVHNGTLVLFNHEGFAQVDERYEMTQAWWEHFLVSLKSYLETGKGRPGSPLSAKSPELRTLS